MSVGRAVLYVGSREHEVMDSVRGSEWRVEQVDTVNGVREQLDGVDVVVSEHALPDGDGTDVVEAVMELRPETAVVLVPAGAGDPELARLAAKRAGTRYVPADTLDGPAELAAVVDESTERVAADSQRYRRLVEQTTDVVVVVDRESGIEYADPTIEVALGYDPTALAGKDALSNIHADDRDRVTAALDRAVESPDESVSVEFRVEDAAGEYRWVSARARSFVDNTVIDGIVVTLREISERKERERELRRYETIVEAVDDLVFALDEDGNFIFVNEAHESMTGYEADALLGSSAARSVPEDGIERTEEAITDLLAAEGRSHTTYEMDILTKDEERIPCEAHLTLLTDENGEFCGTAGIVRDVSDRKEKEQLYSTVVTEANDGIVITQDDEVQFANEELARMVDGCREEIEGTPYVNFLAPEYHEFVVEGHMSTDPGANARFEAELHSLDGERVPVEVNTTRVRYQGGTGELAILRDISARKERERELELYETMLNAVPDPVYASNEDGEFIAINDATETMTGLNRADVIGDHVSVVMDEDDVSRGQEVVQDLLASDGRDRGIYEMGLHTTDSDVIPIENHVGLLTDTDGEFRGSVGVLRDISDRIRRERRLTVLNRALRHDLRNSMHVILANADLIERDVENADVISKLGMIRNRAEKINSLSEKAREIEQILGDQTGARRSVDLARLLTEQIETFREQHPDVTIAADLPEEAWVRATGLIDRAVENLVENSIQHTDDPTIDVAVEVDADTVTVTVADNGPGIPEKERRVVRQGSETPLDHASGLGLWLVAWITRDSGGEVIFEEPEDEGGTVRLELERCDPQDVESAAAAESGEQAE